MVLKLFSSLGWGRRWRTASDGVKSAEQCSGRGVRAGVNSLTVALLVGVAIGLASTPDGRAWLREPTLLLGSSANASASPPKAVTAVPVAVDTAPTITPLKDRIARGQLRVGVFGDSMADGLWAGLYRELRDTPGVTVTKFSELSTGLSRYDYVDIQAKTERQISEQPVDVAVILFGTNDTHSISIDGRVHPFGAEDWKAAYGQRIEDLVIMLRARDVVVYWVGLPRMRRDSFDQKIAIINGVVATRAATLNVPFIPTVAETSTAAGFYDAYLFDSKSGQRQLMRANDGIHMSMAGYLRLSGPVVARLTRDAGLDVPDRATAPAAAGA